MTEIKTEEAFDAMLRNQTVPTIVLFGAPWCGPCKSYKPMLTAVCDRLDVPLFYVDIEQLRSLAGRFSVRGVPTTIAFSNGDAVGRLVGAQTEAALSNFFLKNAVGQLALKW
jgi:thioredoxin-like negative regulator of GroEL